jgi:uncharacterized protein YecA (UPF0149 family)
MWSGIVMDMDTRTGRIYEIGPDESVATAEERLELLKDSLKPMTLPLTIRQEKLRIVGKYEPCPCGSKKKFKWCCYKP